MRMPKWVAIAAGVAVVGVAAAQPPKIDPIKPTAGTAVATTSASSVSDAAKPAESLSAMLGDARTAYSKLRDYSGTFTRQERINGTLSAEQIGEMKMRTHPLGVAVRFARPETVSGMEVAFSAVKRDEKVRYRKPGGATGRAGWQVLDVDDARFLADNRHPVTEWGMGPIIELIASTTAREKTLNNPVELFSAEYQFANRNVTRYEILLRRPHAARYAARMLVFIDKETKLPIRFEAYDEPKGGAMTGDLLEAYSFTDLKINTGLGENVFDR